MGVETRLEKVLEKITEEKTILRHEVNGEIKETNPLYNIVEEAISNREADFSYTSFESECGRFENFVYIFGECAVIRTKWIPAVGYSWDEYKLTLLRLRTP